MRGNGVADTMVNQAAVICSGDVLSHQTDAVQSAEYSAELNCNKVSWKVIFCYQTYLRTQSTGRHELLYAALLKILLIVYSTPGLTFRILHFSNKFY